MKIIVLLLLSFTTYAQMTVVNEEKPLAIGRISRLGMNAVILEKYTADNSCLFTYENVNETGKYNRFAFKDIDNTLEKFYNLIITNFDVMPKDDIKIEFPNEYVWLHYFNHRGAKSVQILSGDKSVSHIAASRSHPLTKIQIMKLFGKKD